MLRPHRPHRPPPQNKNEYSSLDDVRLAAWAVSPGRHCVISLNELRDELGYTKSEVQTRIARGQLHRLHRAVYAIGHTRLTVRGRWRAATLACGAESLLSHRPAGALHDVVPLPTGPIDVTTPRRRTHRGLRTHQGTWPATTIDGIPVVTLPVVYLQLAATQPPRYLTRALEQAQRHSVFDAIPIRALLEDTGHRPGRATLERALHQLDDEPPFLQSELERRFDELCTEHGLPRPLFNQYAAGHLVDCLWRNRMVVVEVDGWDSHRTRRAFEEDRARDVALTLAGYTVLRFTWAQVCDAPEEVAAALRRLITHQRDEILASKPTGGLKRRG